MKAIRALAVFSMVLVACCGAPSREPTFVPPVKREELLTALTASIPTMWSEVALLATERNVLVIDLEVAAPLGSKDFDMVCSASVQTTSQHFPDAIPPQIRLVQCWRGIRRFLRPRIRNRLLSCRAFLFFSRPRFSQWKAAQ